MRGKVRLIGGHWRSRKLDVPQASGLRPTSDRVRETLFNWLSPYISGATCLDLYAGTGVLGFEALSRGAASVVMVEKNSDLTASLELQAEKLGARNLTIICSDAGRWISQGNDAFDIVFIDPPYRDQLLESTIDQLISCGRVNKASLLYVESDSQIDITNEQLQVLKSGKAGNVEFQLLSCCKKN